MVDPLSEVVQLLHPSAAFANLISGKGSWAVRYSEFGRPSFCIMLEGSCLLTVTGQAPIVLGAGDFVLLPTTPAFTLSSFAPAPAVDLDPHDVTATVNGELRYGEQGGVPEMLSLGGSFVFDCADPGLLVALLPTVVHIRDSVRLSQLVTMVGEEFTGQQPGSEFVLSRLLELLLVEAMRSAATHNAPAGLLRGLGDERLAPALKQMHTHIAHAWTVEELAKRAALSRSAFYARFTRVLGVAPMGYLLAWRMQVAKELLGRRTLAVSAIAERVGYGSTSSFSVAFSRYVGVPPSHYAAP